MYCYLFKETFFSTFFLDLIFVSFVHLSLFHGQFVLVVEIFIGYKFDKFMDFLFFIFLLYYVTLLKSLKIYLVILEVISISW